MWCAGGTILAQIVLAGMGTAAEPGLSAAFRYLLAYDRHGNYLLLAIAVAAFFLRRRAFATEALCACTARPWMIATALFPLLCLGALFVYHDYPLSMDEYAARFQAEVFATGNIAGIFPPELLDRLIPHFLQNHFLSVSASSGQVSSTYWPGFSLLLVPFAWLGVPWAANPVLGALAIPAIHRLAKEVTGSTEAAGWAVALTVASPVFVVASISYYPMQAHLLFNVLFALLLANPTMPRALLAGLIGSVALTMHNPVPHLLFGAAFVVWIASRPGATRLIVALAIGYLPLSLLLGFGWREHLGHLAAHAATAAQASAAPTETLGALRGAWNSFTNVLALPSPGILHARLAGLAKIWTWGALGLLVLAGYGYGAVRAAPFARVLAAAFAATFFGYFLVRFDQGHGWGYRYVHSAWFVLPLLAGACLAQRAGEARSELRAMAAWGILLSLAFANGLRATQVDSHISRHKAQVPPLAQPVDPAKREVVFIEIRQGFYTHDMVQNDPFLRAPRITMVHERSLRQAEMMANWFPAYRKSAEGPWGELWTAPR